MSEAPDSGTDTDEAAAESPDHLDETIRAIAQLRAEHHDQGSPLRRAVDRMTAILGRPRFVAVVTVVVVGWGGLDLTMGFLGHGAIDPPPFAWLADAISLLSLYMVILILVTQRGEDRLAQRREMLILELVILGEKKITKVIQLLEESRRDDPTIRDRRDSEAEKMARPFDTASGLRTIKGSHVSVPE